MRRVDLADIWIARRAGGRSFFSQRRDCYPADRVVRVAQYTDAISQAFSRSSFRLQAPHPIQGVVGYSEIVVVDRRARR